MAQQSIAPVNEQAQFQALFEQKAKEYNMDAVEQQRMYDFMHHQITAQSGKEFADSLMSGIKVQAPERGKFGALSDWYHEVSAMIDGAQQPFIDFVDPSSQWAQENRAEREAALSQLSEQQRLADYQAQQRMAQADSNLEKVGAWARNFIDSPMRQGAQLGESLLPTAAILGGATVAAPFTGGASLAAAPAALAATGVVQGIGGARGDLYEATQSMDDATLQAHNPQYREYRKTMTEAEAKNLIGTNVSDHLGELAATGATSFIADKVGIGKMLKGTGGNVLRHIGAEFGAEAADEAAQQVLSNHMQQSIDPNKELSDDVLLAAVQGGLVGAGSGGIAGIILPRMATPLSTTTPVQNAVQNSQTVDNQSTDSETAKPIDNVIDGTQTPNTTTLPTQEDQQITPKDIESIDNIDNNQPKTQPESHKNTIEPLSISGNLNIIDVGDNQYDAIWQIREASELVPNMNDSINQLRNRERAASKQQIDKIAKNLDYRYLGESPNMQNGAPTLANDGMTIIGGNGRVSAIWQAYQDGMADNYRNSLIRDAERYGFTPEQIQQFENPVLIRQFKDDLDIQEAAISSNESNTLGMSALELAKADSVRLPPLSLFTFSESGSLNTAANRSAISQFVGSFPVEQRATMQQADGTLSKQGLERLQNAILYQSYGDTPALARMIEATSMESKNISNALSQAANTVAEAKNDIAYGDLYDLDISSDIIQAADLIEQLRAEGTNITDWLVQQDLIADIAASPEAKALVKFMDNHIRSAKAIRELINEYYNQVRLLGSPNQLSMFENTTTPTKQQLLESVINDANQQSNNTTASDSTNSQTTATESSADASDFQFEEQPTDGASDASSTGQDGVINAAEAAKQFLINSLESENESLRNQLNDLGNPAYLVEKLNQLNQFGKDIAQALKNNNPNASNDVQQHAKNSDDLSMEIRQYAKDNGYNWELTDRANGVGQWVNQQESLFSRNQNDKNQIISPEKIAEFQAAIKRALGKQANAVNVVSRGDLARPENAEDLAGVEGFYNPADGKITLIAENLKDAQHAQFVAWHELGHRKADLTGYDQWQNEFQAALRHETVGKLADAIQQQRKGTGDPAANNRTIAAEEAMMELYAAHETGDYAALQEKYGIKIPRTLQRNMGGFLARIGTRLANIVKRSLGLNTAPDVYQMLQKLKNTDVSGGFKLAPTESTVRQSSSEQESESFNQTAQKYGKEAAYNQAKANGETELNYRQWVQVRTPEFKQWFGDWENDPQNASKIINPKTGEPLVVYHGTGDDFTKFREDKLVWATSLKDFANQYADLRVYLDKTKKNVVMPLFLNGINPFYADELGKTVTVNKFVHELSKQSATPFSDDELVKYIEQLRTYAKEEGSGPYYSKHNFWYDGMFGLKGQQLINLIFDKLGYDSIISTELGNYTVGVFSPNQVKSAIENTGTFNDENPDIRYSRRMTHQEVAQFAQTGNIGADMGFIQSLMAGDMSNYINRKVGSLKEGGDWLIENFADALIPVSRWIESLPISEHQRELFKQSMYRADGVRDFKNQEFVDNYLEPMNKEIARIAKQYKRSPLEVKRLAGLWLSANYAPTANARLLKRAADELQAAQATGNTQAIANAQAAYDERLNAINGVIDGNVAGGYSNPFAAQIKADLEKHISEADMRAIGQHVWGALQAKLDLDLSSGRISQQQFNDYKSNPEYVPLTGDPMNDLQDESDSITKGAGLNQSRDKAMQGATSIAEDGIDATFSAINKATSIYGWSEFKSKLNQVYEDAIAQELSNGKSQDEAEKNVAKTIGIVRRTLQGTTRPSDNVVIFQKAGQYYEFKLNNKLTNALQNNNTETANSFLNLIAAPNRLLARGFTQFTPQFAPINAIRDMWEKSEMIRTFKAWDGNGHRVDMDSVAKNALANFLGTSRTTIKAAWKGDYTSADGQELLTFMQLGGVSTQGMMLDSNENDLIKSINKHAKIGTKAIEKAMKSVKSYNEMFDLMPSFSLYKALRDKGVSPEEAAGLVLDATNFRKKGKSMAAIKSLYIFAQPTATGAYNLARFLSTPKGRKRFAVQLVLGIALYSLLRSVDDEDEGGNKMDELGDITRYIPFPLGDGKYIKIPVGFGMPQLVWNMATNSVKAFYGDISKTDAFANMATHWAKAIAPVSPSEIPASKYPTEKAILTFTPSFLQPIVQNALNRNAFGTQITTAFVSDKKLKAEQGKTTTAPEWKESALWLQRNLGIDMHPEQLQNIVNGYSFSLMRDAVNIVIENPNRLDLQRATKTPLINSLYGAGNEFAIQGRYYEAMDEAKKLNQEYESRKKNGDLGDWFNEERQKKINWYKRAIKAEQRVSKLKSRATKWHNKGLMSDEKYREKTVEMVNRRVDYQKPLLAQWRRLNGLHTKTKD